MMREAEHPGDTAWQVPRRSVASHLLEGIYLAPSKPKQASEAETDLRIPQGFEMSIGLPA
jgi:hypothetical protein